MIITEQKPLLEILESLKDYKKVFLVGCGECATTAKTGGWPELKQVKAFLEEHGKTITGMCVPNAPCIAAQTKAEFAKNLKDLREAEAILVFACGLGIQSVKDCDRLGLMVLPGLNTLFGAVMDAQGNFYEKCSMCAECVLAITGGICPITLCPKGLLNGPCAGVYKGKCEVDKERDCVWILIYRELEKRKRLEQMKKIQRPKDFRKATKPHKLIMVK
jgi:hypothetical protein